MSKSIWEEPINCQPPSKKNKKEITKSDDKDDERAGFIKIETYDLPRAIIGKSVAKTWGQARKEWVLDSVEYASDLEVANSDYVCLCGHPHLKELCYIRNTINYDTALVGNCCVKKFMQNIENTSKIFAAIKDKRLNKALIDYALSQGFINEVEHNFLDNIKLKRNLSTKRANWKNELSKKIFEEIEKKKASRVISTD